MCGKGGHTLCDNDLREGEAILIQGKEKESRKHYDHIQYQGKKNYDQIQYQGKRFMITFNSRRGGKKEVWSDPLPGVK